MASKTIEEIIVARPSSDGDGVKLLRVFGGMGDPARFDPFLMMDEFGSYEASDYIGGFPPHPHRGFETVTYMLEGHMEHQDHMGNVGDLQNGDVQWMTAGAGIIHSEMPKQTEGRMRGFQVWLNLPAHSKMQPPAYQDIASDRIPVESMPGLQVKMIAGQALVDGQALSGLVDRPDTRPVYFDLALTQAGQKHVIELAADSTALVYVYEGELQLGENLTTVARGKLVRLSRKGSHLHMQAGSDDTRVVLLSGVPLKEPIAQYGPFVMNTREEIEQALDDYRKGTLARRF
ncbi:pirin family protein [Pseudohongiella spirulinae]|uniref:Pirin-like protein n=1 Tax=Pseudohongiella spirulinae TaxID=1249552 RepID=A0A0S2KGM1_9GAMM|nr:pirin family protein [Pseudohongiella spirulinae]ALO47267.1 Pirin-like protein [Pseudohongiella spirulinae]